MTCRQCQKLEALYGLVVFGEEEIADMLGVCPEGKFPAWKGFNEANLSRRNFRERALAAGSASLSAAAPALKPFGLSRQLAILLLWAQW